MNVVRQLKRYGAALVLMGTLLYILVFGFYDTIPMKLFEFATGSLSIVLGTWCFYLAGMQYEREMRRQERRRFRVLHGTQTGR